MKLTREDIIYLLNKLNDKMVSYGVKGELALFGGAVMSLVLDSRTSTKDIDAIFKPKETLTGLILEIAEEENIHNGWLNDAVSQFISDNNDLMMYDRMSNLIIYTASVEYLLAMKCLASRFGDSNDLDDIKVLIKELKIKDINEVYNIVSQYYQLGFVPYTTWLIIEEILGLHGV